MTSEELDELYDEALALRAKLNAAMEGESSANGGVVTLLWSGLYAARGYANRTAAELYDLLPKLSRAGKDN